MRITVAAILSTLFVLGLRGEPPDQRAKITGSWETQNGGNDGEKWLITENNNSIRITESRGGEKVADFECSSMGRECDVQDSGNPAKVSFWFNGPTLVELETKGSDVLKRRFTAGNKGDTLQVEVIPVAPSGKTETMRLVRVQTDAGVR